MQSRIKIVLALFVIAGIGALMVPKVVYKDRTEEWMEAQIPKEVPGYRFIQTVKMDKQTYDILVPFGIVGRLFQGPDGRQYEFLVIAGNSRKSFHDPQVCFSAQGWIFKDNYERTVDIPVMGGKIPATILNLEKPGARAVAMYFYRTPLSMRGSPILMPVDLTFAKLTGRENVDGQFYRFLLAPSGPDFDKDLKALEEFAQVMLTQVAAGEEGDYFIASR